MTNQFTIAPSTKAIRRWGPPALVTLVATTALTVLIAAPPADAATRQAHPERITEATAPRDAGEPIMAIVSIKSQKVTIYDSDGWVRRAPVSSGLKGRETPAGVFSVIQKDADHHSNLYDDAWMPHMQRITWSGIPSRCTAAHCRDIRRRTAASACPTTSPSACSGRRGLVCA